MSQEWIDAFSGLVVAVSAVLSALFAFSRLRAVDRAAARLGLYVDAFEKLKPGSPEYDKMAEIVSDQVEELHRIRRSGREWSTAVMAVLGVIASLWATMYLIGRDGPWWTFLAGAPLFLAVVCAYGIYDSLRLQPRNADAERESTGPAA